MNDRRMSYKVVLAALVFTTITCAEPGSAPVRELVSASQDAGSGATLVECPTSETLQSSGLITSLGGVISVGGTSVSIPAGALLLPTTITVTVPASNYMEVDISAAGQTHFTFQTSIVVSIGYSRCTRDDIDKSALSAWYIDSATKALLAPMGGTDDKTARTVTFTTDHLSGYAIAN